MAAYVKEQMGYEENAGEALEPLSEDERASLIRALKKKWDSVNEKYQQMTHVVKLDTVGKIKRKGGHGARAQAARGGARSALCGSGRGARSRGDRSPLSSFVRAWW